MNNEEQTEVINNEEGNKQNRTCLQRYFGKMEEGSLRGSIFSLAAVCLGTGCFTLPIRCTQFGCVWYLIAIFLGAAALYWSLIAMIDSARIVKAQDYSRAVRLILGDFAGLFIDIILIIDLFGFFISSEVIIYSLIGRTMYDFFGDKNKYENFEDYDNHVWDSAKIKFPVMYGIAALLFPLCILKNITKMRFVGLFCVITLTYTILVVIIESPFFWLDYKKNQYKENDKSTHANWFNMSKAFDKNNLLFFNGMANVFFAYTCQQGAFPIYKTLKNNIPRRMNKVFFRGVALIFIIYFSVALTGFMTCPIHPEDLVIYRKSIFKNDSFMIIAKIGTAISLLLALPGNYTALRGSIFELAFKTTEIDTTKNLIITTLVLVITTTTGALYKNILGYISLLGGFCSVIICFLIPGTMSLKTSKLSYTHPKNIVIIIVLLILCTIGFISAIQTIIDKFI